MVVWTGARVSVSLCVLRLWWFVPGRHQFWFLSSLGLNCVLQTTNTNNNILDLPQDYSGEFSRSSIFMERRSATLSFADIHDHNYYIPVCACVSMLVQYSWQL